MTVFWIFRGRGHVILCICIFIYLRSFYSPDNNYIMPSCAAANAVHIFVSKIVTLMFPSLRCQIDKKEKNLFGDKRVEQPFIRFLKLLVSLFLDCFVNCIIPK